MIMPRMPQKASDQKGWGLVKTSLTAWLSSVSILAISR